jgi:hypothetical protein
LDGTAAICGRFCVLALPLQGRILTAALCAQAVGKHAAQET